MADGQTGEASLGSGALQYPAVYLHRWSPQLTVLVLGKGGLLLGGHSLGLLAGSRCLQTAACGGVAWM